MNRRAGAPALREPTSFKHSWLGCFSSPACVRVRRRTHYTPRTARERRVLPKEYRLHRTVVPFGWCPCALSIELLFTSPETAPTRRPTSFLRGACHKSWRPWVGAGWNDTSGPIRGQCATSVATRVIKCGCGKIGKQRYALVPGGLANRTGTISQTWQAANLTLVRWC